jgi:hypothetical protein
MNTQEQQESLITRKVKVKAFTLTSSLDDPKLSASEHQQKLCRD